MLVYIVITNLGLSTTIVFIIEMVWYMHNTFVLILLSSYFHQNPLLMSEQVLRSGSISLLMIFN